MAKCGYTGTVVQCVPETGHIFVMAPGPYIVSIASYEIALDNIFKSMTPTKEVWDYWYESMDWKERLK